ncbi:unnamed protein product, partial [marine sediment metagenome]
NKAGYKTVAINRRGFGESKGSLEDLSLHDLANDVAGVIQKLGEKPVHVVGWAYGNRVARCLAEDHPNLVKTVILLAAGGRVPSKPEVSKYYAILGNPESNIEERSEALKFLYFSPSTPIETVNKVMRGPTASREVRQAHAKAGRAHGKANRATLVMDWWNAGQAPMLVIQGLEDKTAIPENGHILKRENEQRVKLVNLEDVGHFMIYEQPQKIVEEIISFLSSFN